jgi:hypothetical protein
LYSVNRERLAVTAEAELEVEMRSAVFLFLAAAVAAVNPIDLSRADVFCQQAGNQTYCSDGRVYERFGNTIYDRNGHTWQQLFNQTYSSDGTLYERYDNQTFVRRRGAVRHYDNQPYGTNCELIGAVAFCN